MKLAISIASVLTGALLIIVGVSMFSIPLAVILAGSVLLAGGALLIDVTE